MNGVKDGGPAYSVICEEWPNQPGMTLRDWFAGQALASTAKMENPQGGYDSTAIAEWCYSMADAMLAERGKGGGK
jgi:hypothetical protein